MEWEDGRKLRASTTGTFKPVAVQDNWRKKLLDHRIKFDDKAKAIYLAELEQHARKGLAARRAGVTPETVQRHIKDVDPDFGEACEIALEAYNDRIASKIVEEAVEGTLVTKSRQVKADDGETFETEVHREVKMETPLRLAVLRKVDPSFRENSTLNVGGGMAGGVLVVPMVASLDQWMTMFGAPDDDGVETAEEAEVIDVTPRLADE